MNRFLRRRIRQTRLANLLAAEIEPKFEMIRQQEIIEIGAKPVILRFGVAGQFVKIDAEGFGLNVADGQAADCRGEIRATGGNLFRFAEKRDRAFEMLRRMF